jgi:flagellar basal-body rod protein FlgC
MGLFSVLDVSRAGLAVERTRLDVAASNLANARTTGTDVQGYQPLRVITHSVIQEGGSLPIPAVVAIEPQAVEPELVFDPGHPDADAKGFVRQPGVDPVASMVDLVSISRGYEANLRVFDITRSLLQRLLMVGGR